MTSSKVLFFTISGQRFTARTTLYEKIKLLLPEMYPEQTFEFLGNPFGDSLLCPLLWDKRERALQASTRVIKQWVTLNEASARAKSALNKGAAVFTDGLGLDVMLYAAALVDCHMQNDEAFRMHSGFVSLRLHEQGIPAPEYFITRANVETVDAYMRHKEPRLSKIDKEIRHSFIQYEESMCKEYFDRVRFQKTPNYIDASISSDEMALHVAKIFGDRIGHRNVVAA